jgi:hypothetical protein
MWTLPAPPFRRDRCRIVNIVMNKKAGHTEDVSFGSPAASPETRCFPSSSREEVGFIGMMVSSLLLITS